MARSKKKSERKLARRLHSLGLRKGLADSLAHSAVSLEGQLPASARSALEDVASTATEIAGRLGGDSSKREAAARKAAATRKRSAVKRSDAAKKAAKTRRRQAAPGQESLTDRSGIPAGARRRW